LAPGLGPIQGPGWMSGIDQTWLFEGTSSAAAYAGGAAALVLGSDSDSGTLSPALLKRVLEDGAQPIDDCHPVEQGFGLVQVARSIQTLKQGRGYSRMRSVARWRDGFQVGGFFDRERFPGSIPLGIDSFSPFEVKME